MIGRRCEFNDISRDRTAIPLLAWVILVILCLKVKLVKIDFLVPVLMIYHMSEPRSELEVQPF